MVKLCSEDFSLVKMAIQHINKNFKQERHHVASVIKTTTGKIYKALHLDIRGFDVCAESIGLSTMLADDKNSEIETIVTVLRRDSKTFVINPCGNCRQMFLQYSPNAFVIINISGNLMKISVSELLPYPY